MSKAEILIELVKRFPILYDFSHEDHKNSWKKNKIWDEIGKEINESGEEAKKKWKNLRDAFAKFIRTPPMRTTHTGRRGKKWMWADKMEAFRPFLPFATTASNVPEIESKNINVISQSTEENAPQSEEVVDEAGDSENVEVDNMEITVNTHFSDSLSVSEIPTITPTMDASGKQKPDRKRRSELSSVSELLQYFESKKKTEYDATESLFLAHAKTVKTFSRRRQAITKMKIAQLIMEQELLHLKELA
ncbi:hypothetical protein R5R35_014480 [Gryllus longicercus]|uniref:MADF domain-containing protein n=1 Tax=Gryllus longicercus TaxID=2509291 RepID=A0AAN9VMT7_9ORTH